MKATYEQKNLLHQLYVCIDTYQKVFLDKLSFVDFANSILLQSPQFVSH